MFTQLKKDFPIFTTLEIAGRPFVYFDNAATTHKPQVVLDAMNAFYTQANANVHRGAHFLADAATYAYEDARVTVAGFINARPHEVVFTSGSTAGLNIVAHAWALEHIVAGDVIVVSHLEHHANLLPWQLVAQKTGAQLRFLPLTADGLIDEQSLDGYFDNRVKLVAVSHISNALGVRLPMQKIIGLARSVGATVVVDAAQSAPHGLVDMQTLDADFLVFSGHKMMGPTGVGVLYVKESLHTQLQPHLRGGGMVFSVAEQDALWAKMPALLEAGTPPIAQAVGLAAAIKYLQTYIDYKKLHVHYQHLMVQLLQGLQHHARVKIVGPVDHLQTNGHMVSFVVDGIHAHDVAAFFSAHGICVRAGHHCAQPLANTLEYDASVRLSVYWYNTSEEITFFLEKLLYLLSIA